MKNIQFTITGTLQTDLKEGEEIPGTFNDGLMQALGPLAQHVDGVDTVLIDRVDPVDLLENVHKVEVGADGKLYQVS